MSAQPLPPTQTIGTLREWAERCGISLFSARYRLKTYAIPYVSPGKIDFEVADAIYETNRDPVQQKRREAGTWNPGMPKSEVQLEREKLKLRREQAELDEMEGKLVSVDAVRAYEAQMFARIRSGLLVIGSELRDDLADLTDPVRIEAMINARVKQELARLAEWKPAPGKK